MQAKQKLLPALILGAFASSAGAAGFQLLEQNASGIGNAYAGSAAVAENASTIFYNPAGMMELKEKEISLGLTAIQPSFKFNDNGSAVGTFTGNGGDAGKLGFVPNGYLTWAYSKDLRFGVGIGAPFGLMTQYDNAWLGAAQSISFDVKTVNINPSVAYRLSDTVSIGGGLNFQRLDAEYKRIVSITPAANLNATYMKLVLGDDAMGWNAGALIKLSPDTKLGLSYRSQVKYHATGNITASGNAVGVATVTALGGTGGAMADVTLPDSFIGSLTHQLNDRWQLLGDISWTGWSSIPKIDITKSSNGTVLQTLGTDFRDAWRVAFGGTYKYSDDWKLKLGIAYDQTPVKGASSRLASLPDNDRLWLSVGGQWKMSKDSTLDFGAAYLYVKDAQINSDQTTGQALPRGTLTGTYKDSGWILGAQYSTAF